MKILFIVPCYEPGRDGVGDYTRRLIELLSSIKNGVYCSILAWNDPHIKTPIESSNSLRLPSVLGESQKLKLAELFLSKMEADWISIQWVPYGFHPKGLFKPQIKSLTTLCQNVSVHWMIHEIWLGAKMESSLRERLIGTYQKSLFLKFHQSIAPARVSTQSKAYEYLLKNVKISTNRIPLFSNIVSTDTIIKKTPDTLVAGIFSHLHPEVRVDRFFDQFQKLAQLLNKTPVIKHAGMNSPVGKELWKAWRSQWKSLKFESLGMLAREEISTFLKSLDLGLTMTPYGLSDKSGVNAAYLEHGIPIVCLSDHVHFQGFDASKAYSELAIFHPQQKLDSWWETIHSRGVTPQQSPEATAQQFLKTLGHA